MKRRTPLFTACSTTHQSCHTDSNKNSPTFAKKWGSFFGFLGDFLAKHLGFSSSLPSPYRRVLTFGANFVATRWLLAIYPVYLHHCLRKGAGTSKKVSTAPWRSHKSAENRETCSSSPYCCMPIFIEEMTTKQL